LGDFYSCIWGIFIPVFGGFLFLYLGDFSRSAKKTSPDSLHKQKKIVPLFLDKEEV